MNFEVNKAVNFSMNISFKIEYFVFAIIEFGYIFPHFTICIQNRIMLLASHYIQYNNLEQVLNFNLHIHSISSLINIESCKMSLVKIKADFTTSRVCNKESHYVINALCLV
jgi:hypothetical protein